MRWQDQIDRVVEERADQLIGLRHHLHRFPEPSGEESQTSLHLYQLLDNEGFTVRLGPEGCGVIADSMPDPQASRIGLRADIDALRIQDQKDVDYRSQHDGVMHACGHDAHTAIIVGSLIAIRSLRQAKTLPWGLAVRGVFQPAEETCEGAKRMITAGAVDELFAMIGLHVDPARSLGTVGLRSGVLTAGCDEIQLKIIGRGGHGARPHQAKDPIHAASILIQSIYSNVPRVTDSQDAVVVTIGQIEGGHSCNVIPETVQLRGTIRTLDESVRQKTLKHIQTIADGVQQISGTQILVETYQSAPAVINDRSVTSALREASIDVLHSESVDTIPRPSMGGEDFSYYLQHVPGAMLRLGIAESSETPQLHTPKFDVPDSAILTGAKIMARSAIHASNPQIVRKLG